MDSLQVDAAGARDRSRPDSQGKAPPGAEPARPYHAIGAMRARPRPARCLLRLVHPRRRHPRADHPRHHDLISRWENKIVCAILTGVTNATSEKPEPAGETRSTAGLRVPRPRKPAQARPDCVHLRHPAQATHRNHEQNTPGNHPETRSRLTSKARLPRASVYKS